MLEIENKYQKLRSQIKHGDIILFRGTKALARLIQWCDKSYYNHVGIVIKVYDSLYIVDANGNGVQIDRLSKRISSYNGGDFSIVQPNADANLRDIYLSKLLKRSNDTLIRYDFLNGTKELANRAFGFKLKVKFNNNRDICSDFVSEYEIGIGMLNDYFKYVRISFPQDTIRYLQNAKILE